MYTPREAVETQSKWRCLNYEGKGKMWVPPYRGELDKGVADARAPRRDLGLRQLGRDVCAPGGWFSAMLLKRVTPPGAVMSAQSQLMAGVCVCVRMCD